MIKVITTKELRPVESPKWCRCDKCGRKYYYGKPDDDMEIQEFLFIRLIGGYPSVFGDAAVIEWDICQYCLQEMLGKKYVDPEDDKEDKENIRMTFHYGRKSIVLKNRNTGKVETTRSTHNYFIEDKENEEQELREKWNEGDYQCLRVTLS